MAPYAFACVVAMAVLVGASSQAVEQFLLNEIQVCKGIIEDITEFKTGQCLIDLLKAEGIGPNSDSIASVIRYNWRSSSSISSRCQCGGELLTFKRQPIDAPMNICDENKCSDICMPDVEQSDTMTGNVTCESVNNEDSPSCSTRTNCLLNMNTTFMIGSKFVSLFLFTDGLTCEVLQEYAIDLCPTATPPSPFIILGIGLFLGAAFMLLVVIVIVCLTTCLCLRKRRKRNKEITSKAKSNSNLEYSHKDVEDGGPMVEAPLLFSFDYSHHKKLFASIIIKSGDIRITEKLGEGAFAVVQKGLLTEMANGYLTQSQVAIKKLKTSSSVEEVEEFLSESAIMLDFDHPNVLSLLGVCFDTEDHLPLIILPFMANGDLKSFLLKRRADNDVSVLPQDITETDLMRMCLDIAGGMEYLTKKMFVHRDLAARNCMVNDKLSVKVADFGFSRDVYTSQYYRLDRKIRVPVKWMAPESLLDNIYNQKTDVWSFGVTCWEVYSLGRAPYPGLENPDVIEYICNGKRLPQPLLCSDKMYSLMLKCWAHNTSDRPTFTDITECLEEYISSSSDSSHATDDRNYFVLEMTNITHEEPNESYDHLH